MTLFMIFLQFQTVFCLINRALLLLLLATPDFQIFRPSVIPKGQLISKAIYGLLISPKKRTDDFCVFAFLLFMANKSNSSVCFFGESTARQSAFRFYLTFSKHRVQPWNSFGTNCFLCSSLSITPYIPSLPFFWSIFPIAI